MPTSSLWPVRTGPYPPLAKFSSRFGILELKANAGLPVTLRNVEPWLNAKMKRLDPEKNAVGKVNGKIFNVRDEGTQSLQSWLRKVGHASREESVFGEERGVKKFELPKPRGGKAFEVIGISMEKAGLYVVELESVILGSALLGSPRPMYVPTAVLVTNLSAHLKWGRESSLVWVTTLDEGKPVQDAVVTIRDCQEKVLWEGKSDPSGIAHVNASLPPESELPSCRDAYEQGHQGPVLRMASSAGVAERPFRDGPHRK